MAQYQTDFESLLPQSNLEKIIHNSGAIYGLWPDLHLAYVNPAWYRFAERNGGEPAISAHWNPGASLLDAIPPVLQPFYETSYRRCLRSHKPWEHLYECCSRDLYRRFYQTVYPLPEGRGLLVVNTPLVAFPHDPSKRPPQVPDTSTYQDEHEVLHQCAHCRRMKNLHTEMRWDWVPEWVERIPPHTHHTLCPPCFNYYYPTGTYSN